VAGPAQATVPLEARLAERRGAFDVHRYADAAAATKAIEDREVYGAVVAAPDRQTLFIASAASPTVAGLLRENLAAFRAKVLDVVPADPDDPRGTAFGSMILPLVLAGLIGGAVVSLLGRPGLREVGILVATAAASGLVTIVMVQGWLDVIEGPWLLNAGVIALAVLPSPRWSPRDGVDRPRRDRARSPADGLRRKPVVGHRLRTGAAPEGGRLDRSAAATGRGRQPPAQHRFLRRRRQRWPARGAPGVDRARPGRDHGRSGDAAAQNAGDPIKIDDDSLTGELPRPPHCSANGPSVVSVLPSCTRTLVAPRRGYSVQSDQRHPRCQG
jgi:hypothetical protein